MPPSQPIILYDQGANAVFTQSLFFTVALTLVTGGIVIYYLVRKRAGTLASELKWVLISAGTLLGITTFLFALSALPDALGTPQVNTGRINKIYEQRKAAGEAPITRITLSTGVDLQVPKALIPLLKAGSCIEVTRTAATGYILIAKDMPPDRCVKQ